MFPSHSRQTRLVGSPEKPKSPWESPKSALSGQVGVDRIW